MGRLSHWNDRPGRALFAALMVGAGACSRPESDARVVSKTPAGRSTSPSGAEAAHQGKTLVRVVNALPDVPAVSVTADDSLLFPEVRAKAVTPYREVRDNVVTFRLRAGNDSVVAEREETMADGFRYTVIALPKDRAEVSLRVLRDEVVPDVGKARIRFVNASPNAESVDLAVRGVDDPVFSGVGPGDEAGYRDVDPVSSRLEIRNRNRTGRAVEVPSLQLVAGKAYTVVLVGRSEQKLEAITFDDAVSDPKLSLRDGPTR